MKNIRKIIVAATFVFVGCPSAKIVKPDGALATPAEVIQQSDAAFAAFDTAQFNIVRFKDGTKFKVRYASPNAVSINGEKTETTTVLGVEISGRDLARIVHGTCPWDAYQAAGTDDEITWTEDGGYILDNAVGKAVNFESATGMRAELNSNLVCQRMTAANARGKILFSFRGITWSESAHAWTKFGISGAEGESQFEATAVNWGEEVPEKVEGLPFEARKYFDASFEVAVLDMAEGPFAIGVSPKRVRAAFVWNGREKIIEDFLPIDRCESGHSLALNRVDRFVVFSVDCVTGEDVLTSENVTYVFDPVATDPLDWDILWDGPVGFTESNQMNGCATGDKAKIEVRDDELWIVSAPWADVGEGDVKPESCEAPKKAPDRKIFPKGKK